MSYQIDPGDHLLGTLNTGIDVSATGATIAIWLKEPDFDDTTNYEYNLSLGFDANLDDFLALILPTVADQVDAVTNQTGGPGSGANYSFTGNTEFDAKWTGFLATFDADETNRDVYFGKYENTATSSTLRSTSALTRVCVGGAPTTFGGTQDSKIAEVAIWRKVLDEEQIRQYLAGRKASTIEAQDLVGYWPLSIAGSTQSNEGIDSAGDLTNNGATWDLDHPDIWEPADDAPPLIVIPSITTRYWRKKVMLQDGTAYPDNKSYRFDIGFDILSAPSMGGIWTRTDSVANVFKSLLFACRDPYVSGNAWALETLDTTGSTLMLFSQGTVNTNQIANAIAVGRWQYVIWIIDYSTNPVDLYLAVLDQQGNLIGSAIENTDDGPTASAVTMCFIGDIDQDASNDNAWTGAICDLKWWRNSDLVLGLLAANESEKLAFFRREMFNRAPQQYQRDMVAWYPLDSIYPGDSRFPVLERDPNGSTDLLPFSETIVPKIKDDKGPAFAFDKDAARKRVVVF
jgi:hypothetical protein